MRSSRLLSTGFLAGLAMNVFGWLGNQLWLGREWDAAIAGSAFAATRVRTIWNELGSLAPDFVYGFALVGAYWIAASRFGPGRRTAFAVGLGVWAVAIATPLMGTANAALLPWRVTLLTLLLALLIMIPVSELVWRRVRVAAPDGGSPRQVG